MWLDGKEQAGCSQCATARAMRHRQTALTNGYQHHRVHHHENQFARGKNHVNGIESFWSFAKHRLLKLRSIRKEKFLLHLKECEWRWNHRHRKIYPILLKHLRQYPLSTT